MTVVRHRFDDGDVSVFQVAWSFPFERAPLAVAVLAVKFICHENVGVGGVYL